MRRVGRDPGSGPNAIQVWGADYAGGPGTAVDGSLIYKLGYYGGNCVTRIPSSWPCANKDRPPDGHNNDGVLWVLNRPAVAFAASSTSHVYALHNEGTVTLARWDESRATGSNYYANGPNGDGAPVPYVLAGGRGHA